MIRPWKKFSDVDPEREYLALLSYLPLKRFRKLPAFFAATFRIQRQLASAPGLIGYSLDAHPLRREFWTLSVWENENSLADFVRANPHLQASADFLSHMGETRFIRWRILGSDLPPTWKDARNRAAAEGLAA